MVSVRQRRFLSAAREETRVSVQCAASARNLRARSFSTNRESAPDAASLSATPSFREFLSPEPVVLFPAPVSV